MNQGLVHEFDALWDISKIIGTTGNGLFFLTSGYFAGIRKIQFTRIVKIYIPIWFWSILFYCFELLIKPESALLNLTAIDWVLYFSTGMLGFIIGYTLIHFFAIFILDPFKRLNSQVQIILIISIFVGVQIFSAITQVTFVFYNFPNLNASWIFSYGACYSWVFLLGVWTSQNSIKIPIKFSILGICLSIVLATVLHNITILDLPLAMANQSTSSQFIAFFIFQLVALNSQPFESKRINQISTLMFGIYIVHSNRFTIIMPIEDGSTFVQFFGINSFSIYYLPFLMATAVFIISGILEFLRQLLFRKVKTLISQKPT
jgi:hypothetical protein